MNNTYTQFINKFLNDIDTNNISWMWKDIPKQELKNIGIADELDQNDEEYKNLLLLKNKDKYFFILCNDEKNVKIPDIGLIHMMIAHYDIDGILYYTGKLSNIISTYKETSKIQYIQKDFQYTIEKKTLHEEKWIQKLELVKKFIYDHNDSPSRYSKNNDEKELGAWISRQKINFKNNDKIFSHENIAKNWTDFNNEFKKHLFTNEEKWYDKFDELQNYIKETSELPVHKRNTLDSLGLWVQTQNKNHKLQKQIMSNPIFYELWQNFLLENKELFMTNEEIWLKDLEKVKSFMDKYKMRPKKNSSDKEEKRLGNWLVHQTQNYKKMQNSMKDDSVKNEFENFVNDFGKNI